MYIENIDIRDFGVLKNISIKFEPPNSDTACPETGNVMNIIAGVNGCGKTTLLKLIADINNAEGYKITWRYPQLATYDKNIINLSFGSFLVETDNNSHLQRLEETIVKYIIHLERNSRKPDPYERTQDAINSFNKYFQGAEISSKVVDISYSDGRNAPIFENINGNRFSFSDLSHGEKALYYGILFLIENNYENCVILIDEPELGMHPGWQQKIVDIYSRIGRNNQFIIATHSPQIIANTLYQNLIILRNENNKITPFYPRHPPAGVDTNSILAQIMEVEKIIPEDIENLHIQYRTLIKNEKEDTLEAQKIKEKLLQRESNDSKFMQEMRLLIRLRGKK